MGERTIGAYVEWRGDGRIRARCSWDKWLGPWRRRMNTALKDDAKHRRREHQTRLDGFVPDE